MAYGYMGGRKRLRTRNFYWLFGLFSVSLLFASDIGNRFSPIKSFKDDRGVNVVNDNFRSIFSVFLQDRGFNVSAANGSTALNIAFQAAQTDTEYGILVQTSWNSGVRVLQKATTGFYLNYTDPGSVGQTLDWVLVR